MHLSPVDAFLAVATLSTAFLAEILVLVWLFLQPKSETGHVVFSMCPTIFTLAR